MSEKPAHQHHQETAENGVVSALSPAQLKQDIAAFHTDRTAAVNDLEQAHEKLQAMATLLKSDGKGTIPSEQQATLDKNKQETAAALAKAEGALHDAESMLRQIIASGAGPEAIAACEANVGNLRSAVASLQLGGSAAAAAAMLSTINALAATVATESNEASTTGNVEIAVAEHAQQVARQKARDDAQGMQALFRPKAAPVVFKQAEPAHKPVVAPPPPPTKVGSFVAAIGFKKTGQEINRVYQQETQKWQKIEQVEDKKTTQQEAVDVKRISVTLNRATTPTQTTVLATVGAVAGTTGAIYQTGAEVVKAAEDVGGKAETALGIAYKFATGDMSASKAAHVTLDKSVAWVASIGSKFHISEGHVVGETIHAAAAGMEVTADKIMHLPKNVVGVMEEEDHKVHQLSLEDAAAYLKKHGVVIKDEHNRQEVLGDVAKWDFAEAKKIMHDAHAPAPTGAPHNLPPKPVAGGHGQPATAKPAHH